MTKLVEFGGSWFRVDGFWNLGGVNSIMLEL